MARKGSRKVRTGCLTCKVRKIKCDEGKPSCQRCTSTGRKCDGYAEASPPPTGTLWYRPRTAFQGVDDAAELRAIQRFTEDLSPVLAGHLDPYFWTHLVMQFSHFEPAVRHSLVAISALHDQPTALTTTRPQLADNPFALHHYNAAIRKLRAMRNEPLALLVCILFTCIEVLQGNKPAASAHCRHGTLILSHVEKTYPWARRYLSPIFRRINIMPFFFGQPDFPRMTELDDPIPFSFADLSDAQLHLDGIINRAIHLLRYGMINRPNTPNYASLPIPQAILDEQLDLMRRLKQWHASFAAMRGNPASPRTNARTSAHMRFMAGSARVWVETTFKDDEMMYDQYIHVFRELVDEATKIELLTMGREDSDASDTDDSSSSSSSHSRDSDGATTERPRFTFEMGYTPGLYFIVLKCRCLATRLRALSLLRTLSVARENLWETAAHYATGKRVIELEHQISLGDDEMPLAEATSVAWNERPPDVRRIRSTDSTADLSVRTDAGTGQPVYERQGTFYYGSSGGGLYAYTEMLPEIPKRWW
ncbi:uncharacterized protein B0I36DRAFT_311845 [Microdochium trichocladiopsis]|uniref:Zn(2)-C6 fungal-type domain-containing protein n=1 Tax=Microdochium trichocladiopsis TaxID=1682393 RepID=A0A9P8YK71_9PEZI|nr:uncharacterized protein B0I36DRAFT_311845 [Microdochium trichocladiopsis]KAH7040966.1 hypothetical protein B0I36DRAFT_311845 [Microdochium trichocladiopsis]